MSRYLHFLYSITFIPFIESLRCFAGNPLERNECSSLNHCIRITPRSGDSQWSCDGNSISHVSLCQSISQSQKSDVIQFENQRFTRPGQDHPQRYTPDRSRSRTSREEEFCFSAGVLGEICCCQSDFCNAASGRDQGTPLAISLFSLFTVLLPLVAQLL
ncbi:hypothetical protein QR680_005394 [Steinernema hermaphroditum]|uniref:Uncharacterized protein n=1 Tax=Steinernema hermaphroditum TaxID=289476 RepID=A0AA39HU57_9BILA|nr:hypothetical protein QR680_005394 [Steinernema hermaphroditum]